MDFLIIAILLTICYVAGFIHQVRNKVKFDLVNAGLFLISTFGLFLTGIFVGGLKR